MTCSVIPDEIVWGAGQAPMAKYAPIILVEPVNFQGQNDGREALRVQEN